MSQTVLRSIRIMECVASAPRALGLIEIAETVGIDKSTCSRLTSFLVEQRWLARDEVTKRFSVGAGFTGLAVQAYSPNDLQTEIINAVQSLRNQVNETASFHRRAGDLRVCIAGLESRHQVGRRSPIGTAHTLVEGPSSKAILAFVGPADYERLLGGLAAPLRRDVESQVETVRRTGYLSTDGDRTDGVGAVSAPVFESDGVYGSLTISGPASRFDARRREQAAGLILLEAWRFSRTLGAPATRFEGWLELAGTDTEKRGLPVYEE